MTTPPSDPFANPPSDPSAAAPDAAAPVPAPAAPPAWSDAPAPPAPGAPAGYGAPVPPVGYIPVAEPVRPASGLATAAIILTGVYTLLALAGAAIAPSIVDATRDALASGDTSTTGTTQNLFNFGQSAVAIASFVFLALWMARIRANRKAVNLPTGGPPAVEWWGWFIPIANFVLPFLGMRAITRGSVKAGLLLGWWLPWCAMWLVTPIATTAVFRALDLQTGELANPEALDQLVPLSIASAAFVLISWLFLVPIIRITTKRHTEQS